MLVEYQASYARAQLNEAKRNAEYRAVLNALKDTLTEYGIKLEDKLVTKTKDSKVWALIKEEVYEFFGRIGLEFIPGADVYTHLINKYEILMTDFTVFTNNPVLKRKAASVIFDIKKTISEIAQNVRLYSSYEYLNQK